MTFGRLLLRNLFYHWRGNLAVLLGVAVGTAVLSGALLVGDSQRESLRRLALRRLGWVDQALVLPRFFREALADDLHKSGAAERVCPALLLRGSLSTPAGRTARKVTILGVDDRFLADMPRTKEEVVYLNATVARALGTADGDEVKLHLLKDTAVPRETLLGRRDASAVEQTVTLKARVLPEETPEGQFALTPTPEAPRNAFVPLALLQTKLDLEGRVNALLVGGAAADLQKQLERHLTLADWDLKVIEPRRPSGAQTITPPYFSLESPRLVLEPAVASAVKKSGLDAAPTLVYMVNNLADGRGQRTLEVPYSVVAAVDLKADFGVEKELRQAVPTLKDGEIILIGWKDSPLKAGTGDWVTLTWFKPQHGAQLEEESKAFRVAALVPLKPKSALNDANLTPQVRGITDVRNFREWDPPFPFDNRRIRSRDEAFWSRHRTAPKAYVSLKTGQDLWRSRFGDLTSFRLRPPPTGFFTRAVAEMLVAAHLNPSEGGFVLDKVKEHALAASRGGTDFAMLFLAFSFFLILSALLLVGLLFRLNLDRRALEIGLLLATGLRRRTVRGLLLGEGCVLAATGALLGTAAAVLYGDFLIGRLRAWWPGGLDASVLQLHVRPLSLALGYVAAVLVSLLTVAWAVRVLGRVAPRALLQGQTTDESQPGGPVRRRWSVWVGGVSLVGAVGCLVGGWFVRDHEAQAGTFFGSGMLLLTAGLAGLGMWMGGSRHGTVSGHGAAAVARLGVRNAARHRSRSLLTAGLLASAAFLLVGVESFRRSAGADYLAKGSGSGGFPLLAESDLPVFLDLNSDKGHTELLAKLEIHLTQPPPGKTPVQGKELQHQLDDARTLLRSITFFSFRVRAGDDASCLNLYQPRRPRLMGVPDALIREGGFTFAATRKPSDKPWELLRGDSAAGVPVFGEKNTVEWMLGKGLGKTVTVPDWQGHDRDLRIDGLLNDSVFQSALLLSEENFLKLYPDEQGYRFFLLRMPPGKEGAVKDLLETALRDRGFEVTATAERLESFLAVENMYLSTFQALGGMGLLLGTLGLAVVLLRSVWERRGELALLRALGYRRGTLGWLVLAENSFLLLLGLCLGTLAALLAVAPHALAGGGHLAWLGLLGMLLLALVVGLTASIAATAATVRAALVPALRRE